MTSRGPAIGISPHGNDRPQERKRCRFPRKRVNRIQRLKFEILRLTREIRDADLKLALKKPNMTLHTHSDSAKIGAGIPLFLGITQIPLREFQLLRTAN